MRYWTIVPAAGLGKRMQAEKPKQYLPLGDSTVLQQTVSRLLQVTEIEKLILVLHPDDKYYKKLGCQHAEKILLATGGATRSESVYQGLLALQDLAEVDDWVLVHDVARPCVQMDDVRNLITELKEHPVGGLLGLPCHDTLKQVGSTGDVEKTLNRKNIWRALTPQMFRYKLLLEAYNCARQEGKIVTDEASAIELLNLTPKIVLGHADNIKITQPEDLALAEWHLK